MTQQDAPLRIAAYVRLDVRGQLEADEIEEGALPAASGCAAVRRNAVGVASDLVADADNDDPLFDDQISAKSA
jgi:hypothetical protein